MVRKNGKNYSVVISIPTGNPDRYVLNKSGETVVGTFKTRETAMKINEKVEAYWDSLKVSKWCKDYPYGKSLVEDEIIDSLDDWNREKEYLKIADQELDYLWKLNNDGTISLIDRAYSDGIEDETTQIRRQNNELELTFDNFPQIINWSIKKALKNYTKKCLSSFTFDVKSEKEQDIYERAYRDGQDKGLSDGRFVGYNKAIDDFVEKLKSDEFQKYKLDMVFETSRDLTYLQCINVFHEYIDEIAKQLKAGETNS